MRKPKLLTSTILGATLLCCGLTLAQEPVQDIDARIHPHLAAAQNHVVEANRAIIEAQKANHGDMRGHAEKARSLLVEANKELKLAAEAANAAEKKK